MLGTVDHQTEQMDADQLCGHLVADGRSCGCRKLGFASDQPFSLPESCPGERCRSLRCL